MQRNIIYLKLLRNKTDVCEQEDEHECNGENQNRMLFCDILKDSMVNEYHVPYTFIFQTNCDSTNVVIFSKISTVSYVQYHGTG